MRQIMVVVLLGVLVIESGCATGNVSRADGQKRAVYMTSEAAADPQLATVYIYREAHFMGMGLRPTVMLGDDDLVNIESGTFYVGRFIAGRQRFRMVTGSLALMWISIQGRPITSK